MIPRTYEIMTCAADAEGNSLFIIVDADTGLSVDLNVGYDTYAEAHEALLDLEYGDEQAAEAEAKWERVQDEDMDRLDRLDD